MRPSLTHILINVTNQDSPNPASNELEKASSLNFLRSELSQKRLAKRLWHLGMKVALGLYTDRSLIVCVHVCVCVYVSGFTQKALCVMRESACV